MVSVAQYQQHGNAQQASTRCEVFALRKAFGRAVLTLTYTHRQLRCDARFGQRRSASHIGQPHSHADERNNIFQAFENRK